MLNEQVAGLLQNNAANPAIVKRIAEENQLSQTEIAQALKIPEEAAARYMPAMGEPVSKPGMAPPARPTEMAGAANAALSAPAVAGGGLSAGGGMSPPGGIPAAAPASPMGQMADSMQKPANQVSGTMGGAGVGPAGLGTASLGGTTKPAKLPAEMKPQGMAEPVGRRPGGNPSLPRLPAFGRGRSTTEGEQAFVNAFNRLRGNAQ